MKYILIKVITTSLTNPPCLYSDVLVVLVVSQSGDAAAQC